MVRSRPQSSAGLAVFLAVMSTEIKRTMAIAMGSSLRQVQEDWRKLRAWSPPGILERGHRVTPDVNESPLEVRMVELTFDAMANARVCYAAAKLRIADLLQDGEQTSNELAAALGVNANALYRLLRCLSTIGVVTEGLDRRFSLTDLGATLRSDAIGSTRAFVEFFGEPFYMQSWVDILHTVKTGQPAFDHVHGKPLFDFLAEHPIEADIFDEAMTSLTSSLGSEVLAGYDFSAFKRVVDVGGGRGNLLFTILRANPRVTGVLFDLARVIADARKEVDDLGLTSRCELVAGDFFVEVPAGGDAYILKWILHDWDDTACDRILSSCRRAIAPEGKMLLVESVIPPPGVSHHSKLDDIEMMTLLGSQERTEEEYAALMERSGFRLMRILPTPTDIVSILESEPV